MKPLVISPYGLAGLEKGFTALLVPLQLVGCGASYWAGPVERVQQPVTCRLRADPDVRLAGAIELEGCQPIGSYLQTGKQIAAEVEREADRSESDRAR